MEIKRSLLVKFNRIANNHSFSESQQQTKPIVIPEDEINLLYVEGTIKKLQGMLRFHKIKSTFYAENRMIK